MGKTLKEKFSEVEKALQKAEKAYLIADLERTEKCSKMVAHFKKYHELKERIETQRNEKMVLKSELEEQMNDEIDAASIIAATL